MRYFYIIFLGLSIIIILNSCTNRIHGKPLELNISEKPHYFSYRDIPRINAYEIAMIETMKVKIHEGKGYFVYGVKPSAEAFYDSDGQIKGWASLFCEWLTELIGIPFKPEFTDTSFNNYYDANINPFSAIDFFPDVNNHFLLTTNNYERQAIVSLVYKAVHNGSLTYLTTLYNQGEKEYLKNKLLMQLSDEERLFIKNNPVIFFAAEFDNYPVSFYNSHEKQLQGIAIDVLHEISDLCGLSFEQINNNYENFSSLLSIVEKGEASFIT